MSITWLTVLLVPSLIALLLWMWQSVDQSDPEADEPSVWLNDDGTVMSVRDARKAGYLPPKGAE